MSQIFGLMKRQPARLAVLLILVAGLMFAQRTMTVAQLEGFIKSSVEQKLDDKQVAEALKRTRLGEKLDQKALSSLMALGTGPATSMALRALSDTSQALPAPPEPGRRPLQARLPLRRSSRI